MTPTRTTMTCAPEKAASKPPRSRAEVLDPYKALLGLDPGAEGQARELPPVIETEDYILELDEWERTALRDHASGVDAGGRPWPGLLAEGLAFQMRCLERMVVLDAKVIPSPQKQAELIDEFILDATVGITLLDDLQWAINRLISEGQTRVAGRLTNFRNAVNQNVSRLRSFLGNAAFAKSQSAAAELGDGQLARRWPADSTRPEGDRQPAMTVPVHSLSTPRTPTRSRASRPETVRVHATRTVKPTRPSRVRPLILVLALSLVVWLLVTPRSVETEPPRVLTENDMAEVSVITRVEARPPSLYVTLSEIGWREMNSLQRWQLLEHIGAIAASADYVGAQVRTNDGRTVGQWSKAGGAKAVQQAPGDS